MRLYVKLFAFVLSGIAVTFGLIGILQVRRETSFLKEEVRHDAMLLGRVLGREFSDAWRSSGPEGIGGLIAEVNDPGSRVQVRWVWLDVPPGSSEGPTIEDAARSLAAGEPLLAVEKADRRGNVRSFSYFPVPSTGSRPGGLEISESTTDIAQYIRNTVRGTIVGVVLLAIAAGVFLAIGDFWFLAVPLRKLIQRAREIREGHLEGAVELRMTDEIGELASEINRMSNQLFLDRQRIQEEFEGRIEALDQLRHSDRLRSVGRLASGVAHELGTPLNVISGRAELIATDQSATTEIVESSETIRGQCRRMSLIIRQLLDFARRRAPVREACNLSTLLAETSELLEPLAAKRRVKIEVVGEEHPATVVADSGQIEQVVANLLTNAVQATPDGGRVSLEATRAHAKPPKGHPGQEGAYVVIRVRDNGAGITADDLPHVFDPFFTTKDTGKGSGLGLSIAHGIVQEHGGWIEASSEPGRGSLFSVFLPSEESS